MEITKMPNLQNSSREGFETGAVSIVLLVLLLILVISKN